jgi:HemY protein
VLLVVTGAGVALAVAARQDPGYLLVAWHGWQVEVRSLVVAAGALLLAWYALYLLGTVLRGVRAVPARWRGRRARRSVRQLEAGIDALLRGEYTRAEATLLRAEPGMVHYLAAAWAAHRRGAPERRAELLGRVRHLPRGHVPAGFLEARCLLAAGLPHAAETTLEALGKDAQRTPAGVRLLLEARRGAGSHWAVITLLGRARRAGVLDEARARALEVEAHAALLASAPDPRAHWAKVPRSLRSRPDLVAAYARALLRVQQEDAALAALEEAIGGGDPDPALLALYGGLAGGDGVARLARGERWLAARPRDPALLHAVGRIAVRAGQWSRARSFLETAVSLQPDPAARRELGELLLDLGEREAALAHFRAGLRDALGN